MTTTCIFHYTMKTSSWNSTWYSNFRLMKFLFIYLFMRWSKWEWLPKAHIFDFLISNWRNCLGRIRCHFSQFVWDGSFCCLATCMPVCSPASFWDSSLHFHLVIELGLDSTWLPGIWTQIPLTQWEFYALSPMQKTFRNYYYLLTTNYHHNKTSCHLKPRLSEC